MLIERAVDMVAGTFFGETGLSIVIRYEKKLEFAHMVTERGS
jgi:hypothetical protein